jgi:hypothetical protein
MLKLLEEDLHDNGFSNGLLGYQNHKKTKKRRRKTLYFIKIKYLVSKDIMKKLKTKTHIIAENHCKVYLIGKGYLVYSDIQISHTSQQ